MFDDDTLNDRADGDGAILTLFHEWQTAWTASNASDEEDNETLEAADELWRRLCDLPASGPIGIAIKAYLVARTEYANESPFGLRAFNASDYGAGDNLFLNARAYRGLLADAARFVPELAPLMAEIVAAPDGFPPLLASDEELIAAEGELAELRSPQAARHASGDYSDHPDITARWVELEEAIGRSPATGPIGAAVKLRRLADPGRSRSWHRAPHIRTDLAEQSCLVRDLIRSAPDLAPLCVEYLASGAVVELVPPAAG